MAVSIDVNLLLIGRTLNHQEGVFNFEAYGADDPGKYPLLCGGVEDTPRWGRYLGSTRNGVTSPRA